MRLPARDRSPAWPVNKRVKNLTEQRDTMTRDLGARVNEARDYTQLFGLVKELVERGLGRSRAGIMLGLAELGLSPGGFLGGYFVAGSNAIVLNRDVLAYVKRNEPAHHNAYAFHVLLHEYLHTLGYFDEGEVRRVALELSREGLGEAHPATLIASAMTGRGAPGAPELFRRLVFPRYGAVPPGDPHIEIVKGFDPDASPYIG